MTTTTTTTRKTYDLTAIMGRAWDIRRNAAEEIGCKVSEVIMGECLRIAWAEAEGQHAARNAAERVASWDNMTETEQVNMMKRCIHRAARNAQPRRPVCAPPAPGGGGSARAGGVARTADLRLQFAPLACTGRMISTSLFLKPGCAWPLPLILTS